MRLAALVVTAIAALVLVGCGGDEDSVTPGFADFDQFSFEIADALALRDLERIVALTNKVTFVCDEQRVQTVKACAEIPVGQSTEAFDVKYQGRGAETTVLDSTEIRLMIEGMFNPDFNALADEIGGPNLELYSTLYPDRTIFFPEDEQGVPDRGSLAITYIGISPAEKDETVKRRLFAAVAEKDSEGIWRIRLWLVGFYRPDHPALDLDAPGNGFKRFVIPAG